MHFPASNFSNLPWIIITFIFILTTTRILQPALSDPRISEAAFICGTTMAPSPNATFIPQFITVMEVLSQRVTTNGSWGFYSANSDNVSIYTMAQCHGDLNRDDCLQCYAAARTRIPRCVPSVAGRVILDGCFLRYDNYQFYNESVNPAIDTRNCNTTVVAASGVGLGFERSAGELIDNVAAIAAGNGRYATAAGSNGVFGLANCWNTVSREGCRACLAKASRDVRGCLPSREGRAMNAGCYLRYSTHNFFLNQGNNGNSDGSRRGVILAIALSLVAFFMICLFAGCTGYRRWKKRKQERFNLGKITYSYNKSNLNFKYETLEKATNYFDLSRKLGQGGAGSVYRATLPNGKDVAVKRLFFSTRQWVDEFFNEVNLISGIEHKNLVKLLGCSIEGPESLLVYEFMPNKSLEQHLFDKNNVKILSWKERYNIIVGMAEGIAFLHGGSTVRIIHRDIKSSNVLLDENLDAKIADFGLARCFAPDKSHLSTGVAGTLGYMAPEYLVKGQLTEKADVYSFGVLVLEIVCARKINAFDDESGSLLQTVWNLYRMDRLTEAVDPSLIGDFPAMEAYRVLRIGLLCAQASMAQRPSMMEVVKMLTDESCEIAEPRQPPFISTGALSTGTTQSSNSNSSTLNLVTRMEYPSTESSSILNSDGHSRS